MNHETIARENASFDHARDYARTAPVARRRKQTARAARFEEIETQLRRLEYRLIILSLMQGQGRPYLNRLERMQYEDICQHLDEAIHQKASKKRATTKARATQPIKPSAEEIDSLMLQFRGALSELDKEPCDLTAQHTLQETGRNLIPLIRHQLVETVN
jgi:hypothetical protein